MDGTGKTSGAGIHGAFSKVCGANGTDKAAPGVRHPASSGGLRHAWSQGGFRYRSTRMQRASFFRREAAAVFRARANRVGAAYALCMLLMLLLGIRFLVMLLFDGFNATALPAIQNQIERERLLFALLAYFAAAPMVPGIYLYYEQMTRGEADFSAVFSFYSTRQRLFDAYRLLLFFVILPYAVTAVFARFGIAGGLMATVLSLVALRRQTERMCLFAMYPELCRTELRQLYRQVRHRDFGLLPMLMCSYFPAMLLGTALLLIPLFFGVLPRMMLAQIGALRYLIQLPRTENELDH